MTLLTNCRSALAKIIIITLIIQANMTKTRHQFTIQKKLAILNEADRFSSIKVLTMTTVGPQSIGHRHSGPSVPRECGTGHCSFLKSEKA